jgi:SAM-dependent methyltransferase
VELRALRRRWDTFGRRDPLGAILDPLQGGEERDLDAFFAWGEREIAAVLDDGAGRGLPRSRRSALDFGCGAGRLTQAMAARFDRAVGVDISPVMTGLAVELNRHGDRCTYVVNETDTLPFADGGFDFAYSSLVLQHMDPPLACGYVAELVRVLAPGGLLVFQLPSERDTRSELPWTAFRAHVEPVAPVPGPAPGEPAARPGERVALGVRVRNLGDVTWPAGLDRRPLRLGARWRDAAGAVVADDARAPLPHDVGPGETVELAIAVTAPAPGAELELDMVQEGVAWFSERGSEPFRVGGVTAPATEPAPANVLRGRIVRGLRRRLVRPVEMNAVPRDEVLAILDRAGARVLEVVEDDAAGSGWISLRYTVTR